MPFHESRRFLFTVVPLRVKCAPEDRLPGKNEGTFQLTVLFEMRIHSRISTTVLNARQAVSKIELRSRLERIM